LKKGNKEIIMKKIMSVCACLFFGIISSGVFASPFTDFDGIIFGEKVIMRASADSKSAVRAVFSTGQKVKIVSKGEPVSVAGIKGEYPWVEISANGKHGWVFGKFVYDLSQDAAPWFLDDSVLKKEVTAGNPLIIQNKTYFFGVASGICYDDKIDDEMSDPGQCAIPFLYGKDDKKFIYFKNPKDFCGGKIPNHTSTNHIEGDRPGGIFRLVNKTPFGYDQIDAISITQKEKNTFIEIDLSTEGNGYSGRYSLKGIFNTKEIVFTSSKVIEWDEVQ
jgi:hypothetical protein